MTSMFQWTIDMGNCGRGATYFRHGNSASIFINNTDDDKFYGPTRNVVGADGRLRMILDFNAQTIEFQVGLRSCGIISFTTAGVRAGEPLYAAISTNENARVRLIASDPTYVPLPPPVIISTHSVPYQVIVPEREEANDELSSTASTATTSSVPEHKGSESDAPPSDENKLNKETPVTASSSSGSLPPTSAERIVLSQLASKGHRPSPDLLGKYDTSPPTHRISII
jgi:hypothetical protein